MFRDRATGAVVVAQAPNLPLWIFLAAVVVRLVLPDDGTLHDVVGWVGRGALGWWAVLELVAGVNPWRRLIGVAGCVLVGLQVVAQLT
jgi:hypothetical protein